MLGVKIQGEISLPPNGLQDLVKSVLAHDGLVIEAASQTGRELRQFRSPCDLEEFLEALSVGEVCNLHIYYPDCKGTICVERREMKSSHTGVQSRFRMFSSGWGMISWLVSKNEQGVYEIHFGANSEKRALRWTPHFPELGSVSDWEWNIIQKHLQRLRRKARKLAKSITSPPNAL